MKFRLIILAMVLSVVSTWTSAQVVIKSDGNIDNRFQIATPPFLTDATTLRYGTALADILARDFEFQGEFVIVPSSEYPARFRGLSSDFGKINFENWRNSKSEHLVHTTLHQEGAAMVAEFRLFDILVSQQVVGKRFSAKTTKDARLLSHLFADEGVRFLTGVAGIASSEIAFSGAKGKVKEIYIGDYDGGTV
ncbi:MAG TPA: hypothetical protein EYN96_08915, partial [Candidatus Hydrogenedentes bacterium]|nr:hypothetical protein [Candidatus Hydrogenedentota bacterium]